ncbi:MAG: TetR/AcrR family transcriptional regulator [Oligoflexia bacterium]|nr:TetR/AcrR family transcriptional regulator [Oligoflexia bacterium]
MSQPKKFVKLDPIPDYVEGVIHQILQAGLKAFSESGYLGTTIAQISGYCDLSRQRVLYHFRDTDEVLTKLAEIWAQRGKTVTLEHLANLNSSKPEDRIVAVGDAMFKWMKAYPELAKLTPVLLHARPTNPDVKRIFESAMTIGRSRIADYLRHMPAFSPSKAAERAIQIHSLQMGMGLYIVSHNAWDELDISQQTLQTAVQALLSK